jgi:hypothetical protein
LRSIPYDSPKWRRFAVAAQFVAFTEKRKNVMNITELFTMRIGLHDVGIGADALAAYA